jgi:hypothetical protein
MRQARTIGDIAALRQEIRPVQVEESKNSRQFRVSRCPALGLCTSRAQPYLGHAATNVRLELEIRAPGDNDLQRGLEVLAVSPPG